MKPPKKTGKKTIESRRKGAVAAAATRPSAVKRDPRATGPGTAKTEKATRHVTRVRGIVTEASIVASESPSPKSAQPPRLERAGLAAVPAAPMPTTPLPSILLEGDEESRPPLPSGRGERYVLRPETQEQAAETPASAPEPAQLPVAYGTRRLLLVARDPHWLYAHWDLSDAELRACNQRSARGHLSVRIFPETLEGPPLIEQSVHPESRSWFFHVPRAMSSYVAELGFHNHQGEWERVALSSVTRTPPIEPSPQREAQFASLPIHVPISELTRRTDETQDLSASPAPQGQVKEDRPQETIPAKPDPRRPVANEDPPLPSPQRALISDIPDHPKAPLPSAETPMPERTFPAWTSEQEQALARLIQWRPLAAAANVTSPEAGGWAPAERPERAPEAPSSISNIVGEIPPSSPFGGAAVPVSRSFWFKVNAELIVYGATDPQATVEIGERRIRLREDGTFSYRFALPDGTYSLLIRATSPDAVETRTAHLQFERASEYQGDVRPQAQDERLQPPGPEAVA